jgi:hypothetical protein
MRYNIVVVEGKAERAIVDLLNEAGLTVLQGEEDYLDDEVISSVNWKIFSERKLEASFDEHEVIVHVIEDFATRRLKAPNKKSQAQLDDVVTEVRHYLTRKEIEEVTIYGNKEWLNAWNKDKSKSKFKAMDISDYMVHELGLRQAKSYDFVHNLWSDRVPELVSAIHEVAGNMRRTGKPSTLPNPANREFYLEDILR